LAVGIDAEGVGFNVEEVGINVEGVALPGLADLVVFGRLRVVPRHADTKSPYSRKEL